MDLFEFTQIFTFRDTAASNIQFCRFVQKLTIEEHLDASKIRM